MSTPQYHYCKHCNKQYVKESAKNKHELTCEFNQETLTLKANFAADIETARVTANNPLQLFQMLEAAYLKIGIEFIWEYIPSTLDLTCTERESKFNQKGPYAAITGKCKLEFNDVGFKSMFGENVNDTPLWYAKEFYDIPYMFSFARTTIIALPLLPTMYQNYVTGTKLEQQQQELYAKEIKKYVRERDSANYIFLLNHDELNKIEELKTKMQSLLSDLTICSTVARNKANKEFDEQYPELSYDITHHATNLELLASLDATKPKVVKTETNLPALIKKMEAIAKEYNAISSKYPEAFL